MKLKRGYIGAIANHKGGVGKTITTVNLAAALALKKFKVLVVDSDPQSNSTSYLLPSHTKIKDTLYELLDKETPPPAIEDCIYPTVHPNLFILPNVIESSGLEMPLTLDFPQSNTLLKETIRDYAIQNYDFTFVDVPPTLAIFLSLALHTSDFLLIPAEAGSGNSLEGIKGVLGLAQGIAKSGNKDFKFAKIVTNRVDRRVSACKANIEMAKLRFGEENILRTPIPTSADFQNLEALKGHSIFTYRAQSKGAQAFRRIATEFIKFFEES
ncbi:MAG: ParA family protein [Desulfobacterium sp.]|nr:ParA family protein [Desulfobacterium sp.]